jgi:thiamine-phosphate pyrophosphorylase
VWATPTKPGRRAAGLDYLRYVAKSGERRPWFAIGGIDTQNIGEVAEAGAARVVVVRAVTEAGDPGTAVRRLVAGLATGATS